jgi:hypothetical protein
LLLVGVAILPGCGRSLDHDSARIFEDAEKTFAHARSREDFLKAAALYQEILDRGRTSGAVLYNQGNAFMQAGERGRAIAAYRRAQRYLGRNPFLEANLLYALGNQPAAGRRPLVEHLLFWQDWVSYPGKFFLAAIGVGLALLLALAALFARRRLWARLALVSLAVSLLLIFSAAYDWYRYEGKIRGVVVRNHSVMRKGDAESYEPAVTAPLEEGTEFDLVDRRGDWLLVRLAGGQEGWIPDVAAVVY